MAEDHVPARERIVAGGAIDWEARAPRSTMKFDPNDYAELNALSPDIIRALRDTGDTMATPHSHDLDSLLEWADRIDDETDGEALIGFTGFITGPDHLSHKMTNVDGLVAIPGDAGEFDTQLQLDFLKQFRFADEVVVRDDHLSIWFD